jgi:hypothetical protein
LTRPATKSSVPWNMRSLMKEAMVNREGLM